MESKIRNMDLRKRVRTTRPCVARFRSQDHKTGESGWDMVVPRNLSAGGLLFLCDKEINVGELLDFAINLPGLSSQIRCGGMVLRTDRPPDCQLGSVAACFTDMKAEDVEAIDRTISSY